MLDFLAANWLWILAGGAFLWMHTRHGGCGMHGKHGSHGEHGSHAENGRDLGPDAAGDRHVDRPSGHAGHA